MTSLFELTAQYRSLQELATSEEIPEETLRDTLEGLVGSIEDKAINVAKFILSLESSAVAIAAAADAMSLRAERIAKRATAIKQYLLFQLTVAGIKKLETPELILRRQ